MKFTRLVFRNILRAKTRTALTASGAALSIFIFVLLLSLDQGVRTMIANTGADNIITVFSRYAACPPYSRLPVHYADTIAALPGVEGVMPVRFLLSNCRTTTDLIAIHGVDPEQIARFRELALPDGALQAFQEERGAALVGSTAARKYGWQAGQQVSLPQLRGISFTVRGIFEAAGSSLDNTVLVDREYLERTLDEPGVATTILVKVAPTANLDQVCRQIDATFANFETQTRSTAEKSFIAGIIGDLRALVHFAQLVAYFALVLLLAAVANSVSMSMRDRLREMAVLKLLGFASGQVASLAVAETALISLLAAAGGLGFALLALRLSQVVISIEGFTIAPQLTLEIAVLALLAGLAMGWLGASLPALSAARLPIVQALKEVD